MMTGLKNIIKEICRRCRRPRLIIYSILRDIYFFSTAFLYSSLDQYTCNVEIFITIYLITTIVFLINTLLLLKVLD